MKPRPIEPDLATLYARINRQDLDLQPGFQRQEVWPESKKRRLIDTILRGWHIPPIHVVEVGDGKQEVLDGQQRLVAIRDFMENKLRIDGSIDPPDEEIRALHNCRYTDLPAAVRRRFDSYSIRVIIISDYSPEEPGELFFRLNQQTTLTAPEQRNAFFGPARDQVRSLVRMCEARGLDSRVIGFGNSRMAYDDVVARLCEAIEAGTLRKKITASAITSRYRSNTPYGAATIRRAEAALSGLMEVLPGGDSGVALNKGTAHSWLCFLVSLQGMQTSIAPERLKRFVLYFESSRVFIRISESGYPKLFEWVDLTMGQGMGALRIYNDRASSRVADVSSVLIRDYVTWLLFTSHARVSKWEVGVDGARREALSHWPTMFRQIRADGDASESMGAALEGMGWGVTL